jgi:CubicO group peptidase (beta-lactamase class C family)
MDPFAMPDVSLMSLLPSLVTRAEVPTDLGSVETVDRRAEVSPVDVGLHPDAASKIWDAALRWYASGIHPAISMCIRVRGEVVLRRSIGYARGGGPADPHGTARVKATPETPFNVFSASKPMPAMIIHLLDQRHLLHLDDPICEYIPEFAQHGKECVTIRHVLTHRAGIPVLPEEALNLSILEDVDNTQAIKLLCDATPTFRAGGRLAYHAVTGGFLLGEVVRRVTGRNIRAVVNDELAKPLGWRWMNFGVRRRDVDKVAHSYVTGLPLLPPLSTLVRGILGIDFVEAVELSNDPRYLMGVLPAANLIATADELCQFYQLLLNGGTLRGKCIFEPRTVWRATSEQSYGELDFTLGVPLRYGMGFMLGGEWLSLYGFGSQHAFGHLGLTNVVAWADPERHLSVAIMTSGKPVLYPEMHRALALVYAIASECPKDESFTRTIPEMPHRTKVRRRKPRVVKTAGRQPVERKTGTRKTAKPKMRTTTTAKPTPPPAKSIAPVGAAKKKSGKRKNKAAAQVRRKKKKR